MVSFATVLALLPTPAFPIIGEFFKIDKDKTQLLVSLFLLGYALGQLIYGPVSNRYGRKPAIYMGVVLSILGSAICILGVSLIYFPLLLTGRIIAAIGSSVGFSITFTMIGDSYEHSEARKKIAYVALAFAVIPGIAIAIGGFLTQYLGWTTCFYFLILYSIFIFVLSLFLPETLIEKNLHEIHPKRICQKYISLLQNKILLLCSILVGLSASTFYIFSAEAPFIGISLLGLSPDIFGLLSLIPYTGVFLGSLYSAFHAHRSKVSKIILLGAIAHIILSSLMLVVFSLDVKVWWLFAFPTLIFCATTLIFSNSSATCMSHVQDKSNASSLMSTINLSIATFFVLILGWSHPQNPLVLPILYVIIAIIAVILGLLLKKELFLYSQKQK